MTYGRDIVTCFTSPNSHLTHKGNDGFTVDCEKVMSLWRILSAIHNKPHPVRGGSVKGASWDRFPHCLQSYPKIKNTSATVAEKRTLTGLAVRDGLGYVGYLRPASSVDGRTFCIDF